MPSWLPSIPYPPPDQHGYWDPVSSTIDWCEENYYATPYSAEIVNALTNLLFLFLAYKGMSSCLRHGHDTIFFISYAGYGLVGFASLLFHSTLKYPMQLLDEMSMICITLIMCYATFSYERSLLFSNVLALGLISIALFIGTYYHYLQDPKFHQTAYALLTAVVMVRSIWIMEGTVRPALAERREQQQEKEEEEEKKRRVLANGGTRGAKPNGTGEMHHELSRMEMKGEGGTRILRTMWWMIAYGLSIFLGGFFIWNLDNAFCGYLRTWRREVGLPWGILLEGHGWWHVMTGIGAYYYLTWGVWLRHCLNRREQEYDLSWTNFWTVPEVVRAQHHAQNGSAKKVQ